MNRLIRDPIGTQVMKVIIHNSSSETVDFIFAQYFEEELDSLCFDEAGHIAVQQILECITQSEDILLAVHKILYEFHGLICEASCHRIKINTR